MTNEIDALGELSSVIDRLSKQLDDMDKEDEQKGLMGMEGKKDKPDFLDMDKDGDEEESLEEALEDEEGDDEDSDRPSDRIKLAEDDDMADKDDKKDKKDDEKKMYKDDTKKSEYSDVITSEYLDWMENTLKSAGVDTGAARSHFDGVSKANLGSTPEQFPETQMNGQVAGRATEGGSPGTNALGASGLGSGSVAKSYLNPENVTATEIEEAYAVFKAAATEQQFKNNLNDVFSERLTKELTSEAQTRAAAEFDARGPLSQIEKAISQLSDRIDNIGSSTSAEIRKSTNHSTVEIPSTEELANMSWDEVHSLAGTVWN